MSEPIEFHSNGDICRGKFFRGHENSGIVVIITAAIGQIQEQAPFQYAKRLAAHGVPAITFDHRYFGLSNGAPRQLEHPQHKAEDIEALAKYLKESDNFPQVNKVIALGICKGGAY